MPKPNPKHTVKGHYLPAPHLTRGGKRAILTHIIIPLLAILALADAAIYLFFKYTLAFCYGIWCWL